MKTFSILTTLLISISLNAAEGTAMSSGQQQACVVRLSNHRITKAAPDVTKGVMFCSGTLVDDQTLITAAHCLNEVVSGPLGNLDNVKKARTLEMARGTEVASESHSLMTGALAIASSSYMAEQKNRDHYLTKGTLAETKLDIAVVKLSAPVKDFGDQNCPQLPTLEDCQKFSQYLAQKPQDPSRLKIYFYQSAVSEMGGGAALKKSSYPRAEQIRVRPTQFFSSAKDGFLQVSMGSTLVKKGDSGSSLIWTVDGKDLVMGVQSAASAKDESQAFFAPTCAQLQNPRWNQVLAPVSSPAANKGVGVQSSGVQ